MWIDTLAHLDDARVLYDAPAILRRAADADVMHVINGGVDPRAAAATQPLCVTAQQCGVSLWLAHGIHPQAIDLDPHGANEQLQALRDRLAEPRVVALGEIGLDGR